MLEKSEVSVERSSVCNVIENLAGHGIHCLPCSYTSDVTVATMMSYCHIDFKVTSSGCHSVKVLSTTAGYSLIAMITDLFRHLINDSRPQ